MPSETLPIIIPRRPAWNKGRIVGQKRPLAPKHVWSIRVRLEMADNKRDLALFNTAKLRSRDDAAATGKGCNSPISGRPTPRPRSYR